MIPLRGLRLLRLLKHLAVLKMMPRPPLHLTRPNRRIIIKLGTNCKKNVCIFSLYFHLHIIPNIEFFLGGFRQRPRILTCHKDYIYVYFLLSHQKSIAGRALLSREAHRIYRRVGLHLAMNFFIANGSNREYFKPNFPRT